MLRLKLKPVAAHTLPVDYVKTDDMFRISDSRHVMDFRGESVTTIELTHEKVNVVSLGCAS